MTTSHHVGGWDAAKSVKGPDPATVDGPLFFRLDEARREASQRVEALRQAIRREVEEMRQRIEETHAERLAALRAQEHDAATQAGVARNEAAARLVAPSHQVRYERDLTVKEADRWRPTIMRDVSKGRCAVCDCGTYWSLVGKSNDEVVSIARIHQRDLLDKAIGALYWSDGPGAAIRARNLAEA